MSDLDAFRAEVRGWLTANKPPEPDFLLPDSFMEVGTDEQFDYLRNWQRTVYEAGYLGMAWPKEFGGGGREQIYQTIVNTEMAALKVPFVPNTIGLNWAGPLILAMGSDEDKRRYIPGILSGDDIWCQGFSEPDNGSDLAACQTRAVRDGDSYVINGSKIWTTLATKARYMILLARTDPNAPSKHAGLSFFLAPMDVPGIEVRPIRKMTGEFGFAQVFFNDARIPAACRMGREGDGWQVAMATLTFERGAAGGQAGGLASMALGIGDVVELARRSRRDGRPVLEDPLIRDQLVQLIMENQGDRLCGARARIKPLCQERPMSLPLSGKLRGSELARRMRQFALTLQGANAARWIGDADAVAGGHWQRAYFQAFSATIGGGTSQVQANIIGERVLGLPKS
jgi:alkylation response protein AidB-like acyl-CoA dehydrogenase